MDSDPFAIADAFSEWWDEFSSDIDAGGVERWFAKQGWKAALQHAQRMGADLPLTSFPPPGEDE